MKLAVNRVPEHSTPGVPSSLARRITKEHHGRIEVSSVVGKGSKFEVVLPFSMTAAEVAAT